jgi:hypothetical protein
MLPAEADARSITAVERLTCVTYFTREQLADSPTRRDGITAEQEAQWRWEYTALMSEAGMRLRM